MSLIDYILSASEPDLSLIPPIIDCQYRAADPIWCPRKEVAETICNFFHSGEPYELRPDFYRAVEQLLSRRDSERILLYLPLEYLYGTPASFKDTYLDAWYRLLSVQDVRENFNEGDCFEPDARPGGEVERVVKCAHIAPWLIVAIAVFASAASPVRLNDSLLWFSPSLPRGLFFLVNLCYNIKI